MSTTLLRFGKMAEYASLAVYLASDNHHLVGQILFTQRRCCVSIVLYNRSIRSIFRVGI